MTATAITILLISAFLHAGWNLLGKRNNPTAAAFLVASIVGVICLAPFVIMYKEAIRYFTIHSWVLVLAAGFCQTTYYASLSLVLVSMAFVTNVSYVVAFRQISILLGVILSVLLLKEPAYVPNFVAVVVMFIGLVLVGTG